MNIIFLFSLSLQVAEIKIPHSYTDQQGNYGSDIAILLLNSSLQFSDLLQPICVDWEEKLDFSDNSVGKVGSSKETLPLFFAVNRNFCQVSIISCNLYCYLDTSESPLSVLSALTETVDSLLSYLKAALEIRMLLLSMNN